MSKSMFSAIVIATLFVSIPVSGALTAIGEFAGGASDTFDQHDSNMVVQSLPVFGGLGVLQNLTQGGSIKFDFSSQFGGDLVTPINDMMAGSLVSRSGCSRRR